MSKKKICSYCGKVIDWNETCECKKNSINKSKREYYKENKDVIKPITSARWRKLRPLIIKRDGGCCQRCLIKYGTINSKDLQVHHIKPRAYYPELIFDETNLITLCKTCNLQLGTNEELDFEPRKKGESVSNDFIL